MNLEQIFEIGEIKNFNAKTVIFWQEDISIGFYYIVSGIVKLTKQNDCGREIEIARISNGGFVGEVAIFTNTKYPVTATTINDTQALFIAKEKIFKAIKNNTEIAQILINLLANKCLYLHQRLNLLNLQSVRSRLINYLISLCPGNNACLITLPLKKKDLANFLGITPEALSRNLKSLEEEKFIKVLGKQIRVLNCKALCSFL